MTTWISSGTKATLIACVCCLAGLTGPASRAGQLIWTLPYTTGHLLSDGITPVPGGTIFQLGVFQNGFVPSLENQAQWAENWRAADFAPHHIYDEQFQGFGGDFIVEPSLTAFSPGQQMHVWGVSVRPDGSSEQWLGTSPTWRVPSMNPIDFPVFISIDAASEILLGSANDAAEVVQLAAVPAGVPVPIINADSWRRNFFNTVEIADPNIGLWHADPDGDGVPNSAEYFLGSDPTVPSGRPILTIGKSGSGFILTSIGWAFASVPPQIEESPSMDGDWVPLGTLSESTLPGRWQRFINLLEPRKFYRLNWSETNPP